MTAANEKYCGDLKQQKSYTPDYLTHKAKRNNGEEKFIVIENNHQPIIPRDLFDRTQEEIKQRGVMNKNGTRYTNRYAFSGKLQCGLCGTRFISRNRKASDGIRDIRRWQCSQYFKYGAKHNDDRGCANTMIRNEILEHVFQFALHEAIPNKDIMISECVKILSSILEASRIQAEYSDIIKELERLSNRKKRMLGFLLDETITEAEYKCENEPIVLQIASLQDKLLQLNKNVAHITDRDALIANINNHIKNIIYSETFSDKVAEETLDKIVIHSKSHFEVYLKGIDAIFFNRSDV